MALTSILLLVFTRLNPFKFIKKFFPVMAFAFSTSTSNATIPMNIDTLEEKMGVSRKISSFTIPLGATINMDGTSIMQGVAVVFAAQAYGIELGVTGYLTVIATATLASIGTAGIPSVGLVTLSMVFAAVGLPVEAIALIMGIDRILDMLRTAVNITGEGNQITAVALDSARYASKKITINSEANFISNISAKNINEIVRMFEENQEISVVVTEKKMLFKFANTIIASNLLNGEYPNVKNIVPKNFNYSLEVNAQEFLSAIDRVSLLSNEKSTVRLIMSNDEVQVLSTTSEVGSANEKINNFQFNGERLEILFNSSFVIDAIRALKSDDVILEFIAEMKPFVIKNPKDENITQLITPVRA